MEKSFFDNTNKKYILLFPVAVIIGTVLANFAGINSIVKWNIFSKDYVNQIINVKVSFGGIFWYTMKKRIAVIAFLIIGSMTKIKKYIMLLICAYAGLAFGVIISALSMQYGARFLPIFIVCILLHMLFYTVAVVMIYIRKAGLRSYLIAFCIFLAGIFVETIINYTVLPHIVLILV